VVADSGSLELASGEHHEVGHLGIRTGLNRRRLHVLLKHPIVSRVRLVPRGGDREDVGDLAIGAQPRALELSIDDGAVVDVSAGLRIRLGRRRRHPEPQVV
jgi:hypothetical protein